MIKAKCRQGSAKSRNSEKETVKRNLGKIIGSSQEGTTRTIEITKKEAVIGIACRSNFLGSPVINRVYASQWYLSKYFEPKIVSESRNRGINEDHVLFLLAALSFQRWSNSTL